MEFDNEFDVDAPIDEVWKAMLDLERVAPAMPGAQVLEKVDDDNYKVSIKVKVGPVTMQYRGDVTFTGKDESAHEATMNVKAREARGQGTATAAVQMQLEDQGGRTRGKMHADVQLAGKAASMGRGIIQDVSARLVQQFSNNLATMLAGPKEEPVAVGAAASAGEAATAVEPEAAASNGAEAQKEAPAAAATAAGAGEAPASAAEPEEPKAPEPPREAPPAAEPEGIDALSLGVSIAKERVASPAVAATLLAFLIGFLLGRRSAS